MPRLTVGLGVLLVLIGLVSYFGTGGASKTALIPAAFGVPLVILGFVAEKVSARRHAMHAAAALALIALLGSARGLMKLPTMLSGGEVERPGAVVAQSVTAVLCLIFIILCVRSFTAARRKSD